MLTHEGTKLTGSANTEAVAIGSTIPSVTGFQDFEWLRSEVFTIAKSTVENASAVTTFDALVAAVDVLIAAEVTTDFSTNTGDSFGELHTIVSATDPKYTDSVTDYICSCRIYTKVS